MTSKDAGLRDIVAQPHLPALDGLRAVAVSVVVIAHADVTGAIPGDLGVSAFFVLSGLLITRLLVREHESTGRVSLGRFYLRRTMRIFPAYYAFLIVSYALDARAGERWSSSLLASAISYTINYFNAFNDHPATSIAHAWSLAVEEQFYLLWPLAFLVLAGRSRRTVVLAVSAAALAAALWRSWLALGANADVAYVYNAFDTRLDNLAVGCLLALTVTHARVAAASVWLARTTWLPIVTVSLLLVSRLGLSDAYHYSIGFTVDAFLFAILIVQLMQLAGRRLWRWLEWPAVRYLGLISYPIYLYHQWGASVGRRLPGDSHGGELVAGILATVVLASGSYYIIERPFLKLKARIAPEARGHAGQADRPQPSVVLVPSV